MDSKTLKYFDLVFELAGSDYKKRPKAALEVFTKLAELDFNLFTDLWEILLLREAELLAIPAFNAALTEGIFKILYGKNPAKAFKTLAENSVIQKTLFGQSASPLSDELLDYIVNLIYSSKFELAETYLSRLQKNTVMNKTFGEYMVIVFERLYALNLKNLSGSKIVVLKKPTAKFLLETAAKIKGGEKSLLIQRINELMTFKKDDVAQLLKGQEEEE